MTDPGTPAQSPRKKLLNPAMLIGIAVVAVLAIVVVIVAVTRGGDDSNEADGSSTSSAAPSSTSEKTSDSSDSSESSGSSDSGESTGTVTSDTYGLAYDYPQDQAPFDPAKWEGPTSMSYGALEMEGLIGYESCKADAGVDILFGFTPSSETDLQTAAKSMYQTASTSVVDDYVSSANESGTDATTDSGLTGYLYEGDITRASEDACNNSEIHIAALAVQDASGGVVVLVGSYRTNGDNVASTEDLLNTAIDVFKSLRTV